MVRILHVNDELVTVAIGDDFAAGEGNVTDNLFISEGSVSTREALLLIFMGVARQEDFERLT